MGRQCLHQSPPCPRNCSPIKASADGKKKAHCRSARGRGVYRGLTATGSRVRVMHGTAEHTSSGLKKSDIVTKKVGDTVRYISKKKQEIAQKSPALSAWRAAAKAEGYLQKGAGFQKLPKKGTAAYERIRARYEGRAAASGGIRSRLRPRKVKKD